MKSFNPIPAQNFNQNPYMMYPPQPQPPPQLYHKAV